MEHLPPAGSAFGSPAGLSFAHAYRARRQASCFLRGRPEPLSRLPRGLRLLVPEPRPARLGAHRLRDSGLVTRRCALPASLNRRGVNKTDWIRIDRTTYDGCLDPNDYRLKPTN